jgi:hypothetical protein
MACSSGSAFDDDLSRLTDQLRTGVVDPSLVDGIAGLVELHSGFLGLFIQFIANATGSPVESAHRLLTPRVAGVLRTQLAGPNRVQVADVVKFLVKVLPYRMDVISMIFRPDDFIKVLIFNTNLTVDDSVIAILDAYVQTGPRSFTVNDVRLLLRYACRIGIRKTPGATTIRTAVGIVERIAVTLPANTVGHEMVKCMTSVLAEGNMAANQDVMLCILTQIIIRDPTWVGPILDALGVHTFKRVLMNISSLDEQTSLQVYASKFLHHAINRDDILTRLPRDADPLRPYNEAWMDCIVKCPCAPKSLLCACAAIQARSPCAYPVSDEFVTRLMGYWTDPLLFGPLFRILDSWLNRATEYESAITRMYTEGFLRVAREAVTSAPVGSIDKCRELIGTCEQRVEACPFIQQLTPAQGDHGDPVFPTSTWGRLHLRSPVVDRARPMPYHDPVIATVRLINGVSFLQATAITVTAAASLGGILWEIAARGEGPEECLKPPKSLVGDLQSMAGCWDPVIDSTTYQMARRKWSKLCRVKFYAKDAAVPPVYRRLDQSLTLIDLFGWNVPRTVEIDLLPHDSGVFTKDGFDHHVRLLVLMHVRPQSSQSSRDLLDSVGKHMATDLGTPDNVNVRVISTRLRLLYSHPGAWYVPNSPLANFVVDHPTWFDMETRRLALKTKCLPFLNRANFVCTMLRSPCRCPLLTLRIFYTPRGITVLTRRLLATIAGSPFPLEFRAAGTTVNTSPASFYWASSHAFLQNIFVMSAPDSPAFLTLRLQLKELRALGVLVGRLLESGNVAAFRISPHVFDLFRKSPEAGCPAEIRFNMIAPVHARVLASMEDPKDWMGIPRRVGEDVQDFKNRLYSTICGPIFTQTYRASFVEGFNSVLPAMAAEGFDQFTALFTNSEIATLLGGNTDSEYEDFFGNTELGDGYSPDAPQLRWFKAFTARLGRRDKITLLRFCTGYPYLQPTIDPGSEYVRLCLLAVDGDVNEIRPVGIPSLRRIAIPSYTLEETLVAHFRDVLVEMGDAPP